jgi:hypothetical protein
MPDLLTDTIKAGHTLLVGQSTTKSLASQRSRVGTWERAVMGTSPTSSASQLGVRQLGHPRVTPGTPGVSWWARIVLRSVWVFLGLASSSRLTPGNPGNSVAPFGSPP